MLGNSGLEVAPLAFGGNVFGWTVGEKTSFTLLDAFTANGFNFIDTADSYSNWVPGNKGGESETIIGKWLKQRGNRNQVVIATKVGSEVAPGQKGLSKSHMLRSVEDSLRRLQTDYLDLYQSHYDDPDTPVEETLETYAQLVKEGKGGSSGPLTLARNGSSNPCRSANNMGFRATKASNRNIISISGPPTKWNWSQSA